MHVIINVCKHMQKCMSINDSVKQFHLQQQNKTGLSLKRQDNYSRLIIINSSNKTLGFIVHVGIAPPYKIRLIMLITDVCPHSWRLD